MFLTAVLQAHTDSKAFSIADDVHAGEPDGSLEETSGVSERLKASLAVPVGERVQPLPTAHRSRWV
jgi:hypothetical protein